VAALAAELFRGHPKARLRSPPAGEAECILRDIFLGADVIGYCGNHVHMLLSVDGATFTAMCLHGAAMEDMEDSHDAEPDDDSDDHTGYAGIVNNCPADQAIIDAARARHADKHAEQKGGR
jgi:hypothetical protein